MGDCNDEFKYFGWGEEPLGKYKQPKPNTCKPGSGYPQTDIDNVGIMVKGRWPSDTKKHSKMRARGGGAATKGNNFYPED